MNFFLFSTGYFAAPDFGLKKFKSCQPILPCIACQRTRDRLYFSHAGFLAGAAFRFASLFTVACVKIKKKNVSSSLEPRIYASIFFLFFSSSSPNNSIQQRNSSRDAPPFTHTKKSNAILVQSISGCWSTTSADHRLHTLPAL